MADVTFQRSEYQAKAPQWRLVRDATAGEAAVKAGKTSYLPRPNPQDTSAEANDRYDQYLARAVYMGATGRTLAALTGVAFAKWPEVKLPAALEYLEEDADGAGIGLINQSQHVLGDLLQVARAGLLVDYPNTPAPASLAQQQAGEIRATVQVYSAEAIINWRMLKRGARNLLALVVLQECDEAWDGFERSASTQYRVLMLGRLSTEDDSAPERYVVQIWRQDSSNVWSIAEEYAPKDGAGQPWAEIPFTFVGATNNDDGPDQSPLYDLAVLNLAHYRNSADYEESVFFCGQPQVYMAGLDKEWVEMLRNDGIYFGSRAILPLPVNGSAGLLQAAPNTLAEGAMKRKEEQMAALGARLLAPGEAIKTATQSAGDERAAHSVLSLACDNVSDAYRKALAWVAKFMRATGETDFTIGTEFAGIQFDAQQMAQALAAVQAGKLPETDFWAYCRSVGLIEATKDDEAVREELSAQAPPLALDTVPGEQPGAVAA